MTLRDSINLSLNFYSAAATAAGVSVVALAPSAQAKVVYTPTYVNLLREGPYLLDLNGDGTPDFTFELYAVDHTTLLLAILDTPGNALLAFKGEHEAGAFRPGAPIGPEQNFTTNTTYGGVFMAGFFAYSGSGTHSWGPWHNVAKRYLGAKFLIDGEVHYGWARFTVDVFNSNGNGDGGKVILNGYAYETDANTKITAGDEGPGTKAAAPATQLTPAPQPASMGMLAIGAAALPLWRLD